MHKNDKNTIEAFMNWKPCRKRPRGKQIQVVECGSKLFGKFSSRAH